MPRNSAINELSQSELREIADNFLQKFKVIVKQVQFYPEDHPILKETIRNFRAFLKNILEEYGRFVLNFHQGEVFLFETYIPKLGGEFPNIINTLQERNVKEITLLPGLDKKEIYDFSSLLNEKVESLEAIGGIQTALADAGITHIVVTDAVPSDKNKMETKQGDFGKFKSISEETYLYTVSVIKEIADDMIAGRKIRVSQARRVVDSMIESVLSNPDTLVRLSTLKNYDEDTYYHSVNVLILSLTVGAAMEFDRNILSALGISALLHDLGKIKIPVDVIKKPTSLTKEEWELMKSHTVLGAEALLDAKGLNKIAVVVALEHHCGYNGKGYPTLELVKRQHIFSRIVETVDIYDALTSQRSYRKPTLPDNALRLIHSHAGEKLDPVIAKTFVRLMGLYPIGSTVKLNTREYAVVVKPGKEDTTRPVVSVVLNENLEKLEEIKTVNLLKEARSGGKRTAILECIEPSKIGINPKEFVVPSQ